MKNLVLIVLALSVFGCKAIPLDRDVEFHDYDETSKQALMSEAEKNSRMKALQSEVTTLNTALFKVQGQITDAEMREMKIRQMDPRLTNAQMAIVQSELINYRTQLTDLQTRKAALELEMGVLK